MPYNITVLPHSPFNHRMTIRMFQFYWMYNEWRNIFIYLFSLCAILGCSTVFNSLQLHGKAPLSMAFSWQECRSGLPFSSSGDLSDPGIEPVSPVSLALAGRFFTTEIPGKPLFSPYQPRFWYTLYWIHFILFSHWVNFCIMENINYSFKVRKH